MATQQIATALEGHISPAPEQWYIFKPIWPETDAEAAQLRGEIAERDAARVQLEEFARERERLLRLVERSGAHGLVLLSGDRQSMTHQLADVLAGYEDFHELDPRELHLLEALRKIDRMAEKYDLKCVHAFPAGLYPQVALTQ